MRRSIDDGAIESEPCDANYATCTQDVCLSAGTHTIELRDTYGDGWAGATVAIKRGGGRVVLAPRTLNFGRSLTILFEIGPYTPQPPAPALPPAYLATPSAGPFVSCRLDVIQVSK